MTSLLEKIAGGILVHVKGRLDADAVNDFEKALSGAAGTDLPRILVDMSGVDYISSACLRVLLKYVKIIQAKDFFIELIHTRPEVRKVLMVVGFDELLPIGEGAMQVIDILKQSNSFSAQAMRNGKAFLNDLFAVLEDDGVSPRELTDEIFRVFKEEDSPEKLETLLKALVGPLRIPSRIGGMLKERAGNIYSQIQPYLSGSESILDVGCGDGRVSEILSFDSYRIQLLDRTDYNITKLPFKTYDGINIPFPDNSFDSILAVNALHHSPDPQALIRELNRTAAKRILIVESVYLNETQRRFNMFFDWFYNRILNDDVVMPFNFNSPEGWEYALRREGLNISSGVELGLLQITMPEYLWLYIIDKE